jgi:hypothetical protein
MFTAERMTMRRGRAAVACNSLVKSVLVVDIGGTSVKVLASGHQTHRSFSSGPKMTPKEIVSGVKKLAADWAYDAVSIGYPAQCSGADRSLNPITSGGDGLASISRGHSVAL